MRRLAQEHLSMVYSPAGCGKSFFTMSIAIAVAGGGSLFGWKAPKARKVLLVDGEMGLIDLHDRSRDLLTAVEGADEPKVRNNLVLLAYHVSGPVPCSWISSTVTIATRFWNTPRGPVFVFRRTPSVIPTLGDNRLFRRSVTPAARGSSGA
jgi:AAA domain